jgi:MOSC domain-containing protein YiiM
MKVVSTNIGTASTILWRGREERTGIFKYPTTEPIHLGKMDVANDKVVDRKHHGGTNKACYLFSADQYPYWKSMYPHLEWDWGMFGENVTLDGLDESEMAIGDIYKLGSALVQVSQPREPCYKLGIRFGTQDILPQFIAHAHPGTYVRILEEGKVGKGDVMELVEPSINRLTVQQFYTLLYAREKPREWVELAVNNEALPLKKREKLREFL